MRFSNEGGILIRNGELFVIHELRQEGLSISTIARRTGLDQKTVRKYLKRGLTAPSYGPRSPRTQLLDPYRAYLRQRVEVPTTPPHEVGCARTADRPAAQRWRVAGIGTGHSAFGPPAPNTRFVRRVHHRRTAVTVHLPARRTAGNGLPGPPQRPRQQSDAAPRRVQGRPSCHAPRHRRSDSGSCCRPETSTDRPGSISGNAGRLRAVLCAGSPHQNHYCSVGLAPSGVCRYTNLSGSYSYVNRITIGSLLH